jgi:hypothetical protein
MIFIGAGCDLEVCSCVKVPQMSEMQGLPGTYFENNSLGPLLASGILLREFLVCSPHLTLLWLKVSSRQVMGNHPALWTLNPMAFCEIPFCLSLHMKKDP